MNLHTLREGIKRVRREAIAVKKIVFLLMLQMLVGAGGTAVGQEVVQTPVPADSLDGPPELPMPMVDGDDSGTPSMESSSYPLTDIPSTTLEPIPVDDFGTVYEPGFPGGDPSVFHCEPSLMESTGTWLRRGFWFAEVDAVLLNRDFSRSGQVLMFQNTLPQIPSPFPQFSNAGKNVLGIKGSGPGVEGAPRLKLGRFLFRDHKNRDHVAEMILYGGGQWTQQENLVANPNNILQTTSLIVPVTLGGGNDDFTGATRSQYRYDSRFNSVELNYHLKTRMLKDRIEMEPSGHWVRRAQPTVTRSFLAGVRYFDLNEDIDWDAFGIPDADNDTNLESGNYVVRIDNDLIGTQLGFSWNYETARWSAGMRSKAGMYLNRLDLRSSFLVTGDLTQGSTNLDEHNLSFISETAGIFKWHLRPNLSLRASLEVLFLASMATAERQIDFIPSGSPSITHTSDIVYLGGAIGLEQYW